MHAVAKQKGSVETRNRKMNELMTIESLSDLIGRGVEGFGKRENTLETRREVSGLAKPLSPISPHQY